MLPRQPTLRIEPALHAERIDPALATDRIEPALHADRIEPALANERSDPTLRAESPPEGPGRGGELRNAGIGVGIIAPHGATA